MKRKLNVISEISSAHASKDEVDDYVVKILSDSNGYVQIERTAVRSKIRNHVDTYTNVAVDKTITVKHLDLKTAELILDRLKSKSHKWSDAFIINETSGSVLNWTKTESEHKYTSTGIKFWRHRTQMEEFKQNRPHTVVSTHISPEGACNLKCPYCSVTYRNTHNRIPLQRIKDYVSTLKEYGLKAVILTGGGEPTLYSQFNELVTWLKSQDLSIGLITNGTQTHRISDEALSCLSWARVSINIFEGWQNQITFPREKVSKDCVIGCSIVYTGEHERSQNDQSNWAELFRNVSRVADKCGAEYIRILPNCLLEQNSLLLQHETLQKILSDVGDPRYFQQYKTHRTPVSSECHQAYFRPYLSEETWHGDGTPGTVYPCDSVVLNQATAHFAKTYQICKPEDIRDFLERKSAMSFDPRESCSGCVFSDNVDMLDAWKSGGQEHFQDFPHPLKHEEFI